MTELELYDKALIEQNKHEAPTLLIEEYNYFFNKAIYQYINLTYARFDINQQASDDLRWLQKQVTLNVSGLGDKKPSDFWFPNESDKWICELPPDYLHILNCVVGFEGNSSAKGKCDPDGTTPTSWALCRRLTANQYPAIIQNAYLKPTYKRPYFFIGSEGVLTEENPIKLDDSDAYDWTYNQMEIRCGNTSIWTPKKAFITYLRKPKKIELTWDQVNGIEDTSDECEFPDAVAYEIINIFVKLLLENASDPRMQTNFAINQTVGGIPQTESKK